MDKATIKWLAEMDDWGRRRKLMMRSMVKWLKRKGFREWLQEKNNADWKLSVMDIQEGAKYAIKYSVFKGVIINKGVMKQIEKDYGVLFFDPDSIKMIADEIHNERKAKPVYIQYHKDKRNRRRRERYAERKADNA
jgi:hypothetical protein